MQQEPSAAGQLDGQLTGKDRQAFRQNCPTEEIATRFLFPANVLEVEKRGLFDRRDGFLEAIEKLSVFFGRLGLPQSLGDTGIDGSRITEMAERLTGVAYGQEEQRYGFAYPLGTEDWINILKACL